MTKLVNYAGMPGRNNKKRNEKKYLHTEKYSFSLQILHCQNLSILYIILTIEDCRLCRH